MTRVDKLYRLLDSLETELLGRLREEFGMEATGMSSALLSAPPFYGPFYGKKLNSIDLETIDHLHRLVSKVESIRHKLGEPIPGPVLSILYAFRATWNELGVKQDEGAWRFLVKQALSDFNALVEHQSR
jgi:hypothetical protein